MNQNLMEEAELKANNWLHNPVYDAESKKEIKDLIEGNQKSEILNRFYKNLEFGTGGMRGILGMGSNRVNKYNMRKAAWSLGKSIQEANPGEEHLAVISYDPRTYSDEFSKECALVLVAMNIKVYLFERLNPVGMLSFMIRHLKAHGGIMITASHNPKNYNGFKAYWKDGAQVTPPWDQKVISNYNAIDEAKEIKVAEIEKAKSSGFLNFLGQDHEQIFYDMIRKQALIPEVCQREGHKIKLVYTPLHGTGRLPVCHALRELGAFDVLLVEDQATPDANFSTVIGPNPEDPEALKKAVDLMMSSKAHLAFGTDPDADRLGVVVRHNERPYYLNGNELAVLLLEFSLEQLILQNKLPKNAMVLKTIVTSPMQNKIAKDYGVRIEDTLTGFKWIAKRLKEIEEAEGSSPFVFASEESFGVMTHCEARDKDAIGGITRLTEMTLHYHNQGKTLINALDDLYKRYGLFREFLISKTLEGKEGQDKIEKIMDSFRSLENYDLFGENLSAISDYKSGERKVVGERSSSKLNLPESNVLGLEFKSGNMLFLRPSGTEPKIKFYIMLVDNENEDSLLKRKDNLFSHFENYKKAINIIID